ncbi:hypothetical protein A5633_10330 [Mycolicibacterium elephantis]|nr:hypothetical protein A5633_10330 [Mycolicibacterium elephantis]
MLMRVAVHLAGGGQHQPRATAFGEVERVGGAQRTGAQRLHRQPHVVHRRRRGREVEDGVDIMVNTVANAVQRLADVVPDEPVPGTVVQQRGGGGRAGGQVVHADDLHTVVEQSLAQVATEESATAGHHDMSQVMHRLPVRSRGYHHSHDAVGHHLRDRQP